MNNILFMVRSLLYVSIFLSAALLFLIQPLFAKYLVPFYGGTSAVWIISISFYSTALLFGYLYASVLTSLPLKTARTIHTVLLTLTGALLLSQWFEYGVPLYGEPVQQGGVAISAILTLLKSVGLPVVLLASTSVIVQHLFAKHTQEDPYWLYALSNAGSLIGLAAFPFLLERYVALPLQMGVWAGLFLVFLLVLLSVWRQVEQQSVSYSQPVVAHQRLTHRFAILVYAAVPTFLLASFTDLFSRGIASFPLIWVVPLMLYLITFIVTFRTWPQHTLLPPLGFWAFVATLPAFIFLPSMNFTAPLFWTTFVCVMGAFFFITCYFHRRLYLMRPSSGELGSFYVWLTFGGAIGSGVVSLLLPVLLRSDKEAFFAFACVSLYFMITQLGWLKRWVSGYLVFNLRVFFFLMVCLFLMYTAVTKGYVDSERNFYGAVKIYESDRIIEEETVRVRYMVHGVTSHGLEALDSRFAEQAVSYYGPGSGIELAIRSFQERGAQPALNVIGLGAGMMNVYCDSVSSIHYIEINPLVQKLAEEYFGYLDTCTEKVTIEIADGRLALERHHGEPFDIIMVDAFSDDAIPIHLLTEEAFYHAYRPHLSEEGMLVVHISNKFLNLYPAVAGMAEQSDFVPLRVINKVDAANPLSMTTSWVVLARQEQAEKLVQYQNVEYYEGERAYWTDSRSSILEVLSFKGSF